MLPPSPTAHFSLLSRLRSALLWRLGEGWEDRERRAAPPAPTEGLDAVTVNAAIRIVRRGASEGSGAGPVQDRPAEMEALAEWCEWTEADSSDPGEASTRAGLLRAASELRRAARSLRAPPRRPRHYDAPQLRLVQGSASTPVLNHRIRRPDWPSFFEGGTAASRSPRRYAAVRVATPGVMGERQVGAGGLPLLALTYEPVADLLTVEAEGLTHRVLHPTGVWMDEGGDGVVRHLVARRADGGRDDVEPRSFGRT